MNKTPLRRTYFLYAFQTRYAFAFVVLSLTVSFVIAFGCFKTFSRLGLDGSREILEDAAFERELKWLLAGVATLAISSFGSFHLLISLVSHRVMAPLSLLTQHMRELANGHYPDSLPLPPNDEWIDTFRLLALAADRLKARHLEEIATIRHAIQAISTVKPVPGLREVEAEFQLTLTRLIVSQELDSPPVRPSKSIANGAA